MTDDLLDRPWLLVQHDPAALDGLVRSIARARGFTVDEARKRWSSASQSAAPNLTVRQVLARSGVFFLDQDGGQVSGLLDANWQMLEREATHRALSNLLRAVARERGIDSVAALRLWSTGCGHIGPGASAREVLSRSLARTELDRVEADVRLLEARDAAVEMARERVHTLASRGADEQGRVRIDAVTYGQVVGGDGVKKAERFFRGRQLDGRYQGAEGEARFARDDEEAARAGLDLVAQLEADGRASVAGNELDTIVRRLDTALARGETVDERRRLLDAAIRKGEGELRALEQQQGGGRQPDTSDRGFAAVDRQLRLLEAAEARHRELGGRAGEYGTELWRRALEQVTSERGGAA